MRRSTFAVLAAGACLVAMLPTDAARAQSLSVLNATLAETGLKTPEISTADLRGILSKGDALLLDTRSRAEFEAGHIPGAINLDGPASEQVPAVLRMVSGDKSRMLVLYCNGPFCQASRRAGEQLAAAGFSNVRRYQLGMPIWRALGGPTAVELGGVARILGKDATAVFIDARRAEAFASGSLAGARSAPVEDVAAGRLKKIDLPEDDFNRRIVLFGSTADEARRLAEHMSERPWHNVMFFAGTYEQLARLAPGSGPR